MNENLQPQTLVIKDWVSDASKQLSNIGILSAHLDAEIILSHTLNKNRTYLHAHSDEHLNVKDHDNATKLLKQRLKRKPIAYIVGFKEFFGRNFIVNTKTLIPRPESEDIILLLRNILYTDARYYEDTEKLSLFDIGTGSGCLGITAKLEFPKLDVFLSDIDSSALKIAKKNAKKLSANIEIIKSELFDGYNNKTDIIIANLPYVNKNWVRSPETNYEPSLALFSDKGGRLVIEKLLGEANNSLKLGGYVLIEADPTQHKSLIKFAKKYNYINIHKKNYIIAFKLNDVSANTIENQ